MALVRYDPLREVTALQNELRRSLEAMFRGVGGSGQLEDDEATWVPAVDVKETDNELRLSFDLPGMKEEDISIEIQDNVLSVSGEREERREESREGFRRMERRFGRFARSFPLPAGVSEDKIQASYDNGVLEIRVPKPKDHEPRRVQIGAGRSGAKSVARAPRQGRTQGKP